jgi:hypothetical protein
MGSQRTSPDKVSTVDVVADGYRRFLIGTVG